MNRVEKVKEIKSTISDKWQELAKQFYVCYSVKELAYSIGNETTGYYYLTHFRANANEIQKIEMNLRLNDNVMKYITIKTED